MPFTRSHHHGAAGASGNKAFITTWLTTSPDESITLPLRSGFTYDMSVDWGDGVVSAVTAYNDADRTHQYTNPGTHRVTIKGTCQALYFNNGGSCEKFRTVVNWGDMGFTGAGLEQAFYGCVYATDFGDTLTGATAVTSLIETFENCGSATRFPEISDMTQVTSMYKTYYNCSSCSLFPPIDTLTSITDMRTAYRACTSMSALPVLPSSSAALLYAGSAFYDCTAATGTAMELWAPSLFPNIVDSVTGHYYCFRNCTQLTNYSDIPADWK